jgi:hypothetical protein
VAKKRPRKLPIAHFALQIAENVEILWFSDTNKLIGAPYIQAG